jgi:tetratricopeptide (TPR) repeat protein
MAPSDPLLAVIRRGIELFRPSGAETVDRQPSQTNDHWAFCWVPPLHHFQQGRQPGDATYNEEMARDSAFSNPRACAGMAEAFGIDEVTCHLADIRSCRSVAQSRPSAETSAAAASASTGDETAPTDANTAAPEDWYYDTLRRRQDEHWASERLRVGVRHARDGQMAEAMRCYEHALRLCPSHGPAADTHVARGAAYANTGRLSHAVREFERALELDPSSRNAREYLDATKRRLGVPLTHPAAVLAAPAHNAPPRSASEPPAPTLCSAASSFSRVKAMLRDGALPASAEGSGSTLPTASAARVAAEGALEEEPLASAAVVSLATTEPPLSGGGHHGSAGVSDSEGSAAASSLSPSAIGKKSKRKRKEGKEHRQKKEKRRKKDKKEKKKRKKKKGKEESASSSEGEDATGEEGESHPILDRGRHSLWGF